MLKRKGSAFIPTLKDGVFPLCHFQSPEEKPIELEKLNLILEDGTGTSLAVADVLTQLVIGGATSAAVLGAWHYYRLREAASAPVRPPVGPAICSESSTRIIPPRQDLSSVLLPGFKQRYGAV